MKKTLILFIAVLAFGTLTGCANVKYADAGDSIITPKEMHSLIGKEKTVIVDMQDTEDYSQQHVDGAVNITISSILVNLPVENMLAPKGKIQNVC